MNDHPIFDATAYDLPVPRVDGVKADRILLNISGTIELDRTDTDDLEYLEQLKVGRELPIQVTAVVTGKGSNYRFTDEATSMTYQVRLKTTGLIR